MIWIIVSIILLIILLAALYRKNHFEDLYDKTKGKLNTARKEVSDLALDFSKVSFNLRSVRTDLQEIKGKEKARIRSNFNSFVEKRKMWVAFQDGVKKYRKCSNFVHGLTMEQTEYYQSLCDTDRTDIWGLVASYFRLKFVYLKEKNDTFESPAELISIRKKNRFLINDCDGRALDLYYFLKANGCKDIFKLQIVNTILQKHMNLVLWNDTVNDWCTIETTIWADQWATIMNQPARFQSYSRPEIVFDNQKEYEAKW